MSKKYIIISFCTLLFANCLILISSCGTKKTEPAAVEEVVNESTVELTDAQFKNADIKTAKIEQRNISSLLKVKQKQCH